MSPRRAIVLLVVTALALAGCGAIAGARAKVAILASWAVGSGEAEQFTRVAAAFAAANGFDIDYQGVREVNSVLRVELASGSPPDIAMPSSPAVLAAYAESGKLVLLDGDTAPRGQLLFGRRDPGRAYGVVLKTSLKSMVWRDASATSAPPKTWDELVALSRALRAGRTPWCVAVESGAQSGWPGTDWIEDILLHQSGPTAYQAWATGQLPWTSPEVRSAWTAWSRLLAESGMASPAAARRMLLTTWSDAVKGACAMEHQGSFARDIWRGASRDPSFFMFPSFSGPPDAGVAVGVDVAGLFTDKPEARALLRHLASRSGQEAWIREAGGGFFSPRTDLDRAAVYGPPSAIERQIADHLAIATRRCVDASDFMPATVADAFSAAVLEFLSDPDAARIPGLLRGLEQVRASVTTGWLADPCTAPR
ncbi:ABC transporter substrate-binding protein [Luedemannella flava]|uniref:ABC transporter substrate-binding protein n=1 Tax=Luedemannella flava TaxID=349316 RepID=A0ABP4YHB9_9ACTN